MLYLYYKKDKQSETNKNSKDDTYFKTDGVFIITPFDLECKKQKKITHIKKVD